MSNDLAQWVLEGREPHEAEVTQYLHDAIARSLSATPMTREQLADNSVKQIQQFLESLSTSSMLIDDTPISAGWLRECGIPVPGSIPDCATVPRSAMRMEMTDSGIAGDTMTVGMKATFSEPFKWVEATVIVNDGHDGSEM